MNKSLFTFSAIAACLAVCAICVVPALAAKGDEPTETTVDAKYKAANPADPYGTNVFKGTVGPKKCAKGRSVSVKGLDKDKTNKKGKFEIELSGDLDPDKYKVKVKAKGDCAAGKDTVKVK